MGSERGRLARRIFEQAVETPTAARAGFLDSACSGDEALRAAVERLLRADADAGSFLRQPLVGPTPAKPFQPPQRVGPYRLREKIGEGGMGAVYRALRDDEAFDREAAVKLIAHGGLTEEIRRRLRIERQILATLDHPWIARIFDGGTTEGGVPYLVMEMIDGQPIDRYCEAHDLSVRQRIELFRQICSAVHYSHQNLVVHCDLKPSNILVDTSGAPKLLDFGIAKLLQQGSAGDRDDPTTLGSRPLTPEYASPEQFRGEALSTVSDVYSLGVLLYKLLTGQRPATAERLSRPAADDDIAPPSAATRDRSPDLSRRLRGDLDAIVLKALRASPDERFGSAAQLSEDLGRYLEGFPVHARQGNLSYRAKRFLRRHRLAVSAAIVSFAVLGFFAFSMASLAGRLTEEQAKLQEVVGFFRLFFERAGPLVSQGRNLTLREAVDQNAAMIVDGLADQPAVKVEIATVLGDIYRELGQPEQALAWSDRALELHRQLAGEDSHAYSLGLVRLGAALRELGRYEEAEAKTRDGLDRLRAHSDTEPAQLVDSLNNLVSLLCYEERYQEAVDHSIAALSLAEDQLGDTAIETMTAIANRGLVLRQLGQAGEAKRLYERAIALFRHRLGGSHPLVATLLLNLSSIERDQGDLAMAENTLEEANQQYLEMFGREHYGRIRPLVGLAKLAARQQRVDEAVERYREAIEVAIASQAPPPFVLRPTLDLATLMVEADRCDEGESTLRDSLEHSRAHADRFWRYAAIESLLGDCLARQPSRREEARSLLERSYERLAQQPDIDRETLRRVLQRLESFYASLGDDPARPREIISLQSLGP